MGPFEKTDDFLKKGGWIKPGDRLLVAVSGGIDSMVLLAYLSDRHFDFSVAHANFGLRGADSDEDERFVEEWCGEHHITFYGKRFDTAGYAGIHGISTQMAARDLRYAWFNELLRSFSYTWLLTAHHASDQTETLLLNLVRGTGIKGLTGIRPASGSIIRPFLGITREEIQAVATDLGIKFREDQSNSGIKYRRNRIRHRVVPELKKINPSLDMTMAHNADRIAEALIFLEHSLQPVFRDMIIGETGRWVLNTNVLVVQPAPEFVLHSALDHIGFNYPDAGSILSAVRDGLPGKLFYSGNRRLLVDRGRIIVEDIPESPPVHVTLNGSEGLLQAGEYTFRLETVAGSDWKKDPDAAYLDADKLKLPITVRNWKNGDRMRPSGMKGYKKISDILIDAKVPLTEKGKVLVVLAGNEIAWLAGYRVSESFAVSSETRRMLLITLIKTQSRH